MGSPPQVRGKLSPSSLGLLYSRITPAGAGKTRAKLRCFSARRDHPRRCGENVSQFCHEQIPVGSPPQVRGKLKCALLKNHADRITPAGAGKTYIAST